MAVPNSPLRPTQEPKAISLFVDRGHPFLGFVIAMSWIWRGVVGTLLVTIVAGLLK